MGPLGWQETVVIFVLALLLFGPKKLPELGKNLAKALSEFRRASNELKQTWSREMESIERETQDIKKEAESLGQVATDYNSDSSYNYNYDYDSSYDYGAYGYPDSDAPSPSAETTTVSASATQGADDAATAASDAEPGLAPAAEDSSPRRNETPAGDSSELSGTGPAPAGPAEPASAR